MFGRSSQNMVIQIPCSVKNLDISKTQMISKLEKKLFTDHGSQTMFKFISYICYL